MTTRLASSAILTVCCLVTFAPMVVQGKGATVTIARATGESIEGELLVVADSTFWMKTAMRPYNMRLGEEDSCFVLRLGFSEVSTVVIEGSSKVLWGTVIGLGLGAVIGATVVEHGWEAQGALITALPGTVVGALVGSFASRKTRVFVRESPEGFAPVAEYARFGTKVPNALELLK
jgi:hypothetical protein